MSHRIQHLIHVFTLHVVMFVSTVLPAHPGWKCPLNDESVTNLVGGLRYQLKLLSQSYVQWQSMLSYLVQRDGDPGPPSLFFHFADSRLLTHECFMSHLRYALAGSGIDSSLYAGHCFRTGAATIAALKGLQDSLIKTLGCWESSAYMLYIWTPHILLLFPCHTN